MDKVQLLQFVKTLTNEEDITKLISAAEKLEKYLNDNQNIKNILLWSEDINHFANMIKISHPVKGCVKWNPHGYQRDLLTRMATGQKILITHARQLGMTTTLIVYALWKAQTCANYSVVIATPSFNCVKSVLEKMNVIYDGFSDGELCPLTQRNSTRMRFDNNSSIDIITANATMCGTSIDLLIIDNAAYISHSKSKDFWTSMLPTIRKNGQIIISSCAGDNTGLFYDLWKSEQFFNITLPWQVDPTRDLNWADKQSKTIGKDAFDQQYNCKFIS